MSARNVEEHIAELFAFLQREFPTPYPVTLRWQYKIPYGRGAPNRFVRERGIWGDTWREGRQIVIRLSKRRNRQWPIAEETLNHEYAHAVNTRHDRMERHREDDHDDEWALIYGRILRAVYRRDGIKA